VFLRRFDATPLKGRQPISDLSRIRSAFRPTMKTLRHTVSFSPHFATALHLEPLSHCDGSQAELTVSLWDQGSQSL